MSGAPQRALRAVQGSLEGVGAEPEERAATVAAERRASGLLPGEAPAPAAVDEHVRAAVAFRALTSRLARVRSAVAIASLTGTWPHVQHDVGGTTGPVASLRALANIVRVGLRLRRGSAAAAGADDAGTDTPAAATDDMERGGDTPPIDSGDGRSRARAPTSGGVEHSSGEPASPATATLDQDIMEAARHEDVEVTVEELAARADARARAPSTALSPAVSPAKPRTTAKQSLFHDLYARMQHDLMVIELRKGDTSVTYRSMNRNDILKEARRHASVLADIAADIVAGAGPVGITTFPGIAGTFMFSPTAVAPEVRTHGGPFLGPSMSFRSPKSRSAASTDSTSGRAAPSYLSARGLQTSRDAPNAGMYASGSFMGGESMYIASGQSFSRLAEPLGKDGANTQVNGGGAEAAAGGARGRSLGAVSSLLQSRDLRVVDCAFEIAREPAILVRKHCMVVNLPPIRAIIMADKCFFFPEEGMDDDLVPILERISQRAQPRTQPSAAAVSSGTGSAVDGAAKDDDELPLEFFLLETFLYAVSASLRRALEAVTANAMRTVRKMTRNSGRPATLFNLQRRTRREIIDLTSKVKAIHRVLAEVLDTPEDLRSMALTALLESELALLGGTMLPDDADLSTIAAPFTEPPSTDAAQRRSSAPGGKPTGSEPSIVPPLPPFGVQAASGTTVTGDGSTRVPAPPPPPMTHRPLQRAATSMLGGLGGGLDVPTGSLLSENAEAAEVLLESYLAEIEATLARVKLLREDLDAAENQMNLTLANNRNRLLKTEIGITTVTMCMTACGVVASYFGMNIKNGHEENFGTFLWVSIASTVTALLVAVALWLYLRTMLR